MHEKSLPEHFRDISYSSSLSFEPARLLRARPARLHPLRQRSEFTASAVMDLLKDPGVRADNLQLARKPLGELLNRVIRRQAS